MKHTLYIGITPGISFILLMHSFFLIFGEGSYIKVHDKLDSEFIYLHVLKISGNLFGGSGSVPNIFNGIDRAYFSFRV